MPAPVQGLSVLIALAGLAPAHAAPLSYAIPLNTPKVESLGTSLSPTGGVVQIQLQVKYDLAGAVTYTGTLDGSSVAGKPTIKTSAGTTTYKFSLKAATAPATVVSISGTVGVSTATCNYTGPKGRTNVPANPVSLTVLQPVPATLQLSPNISDKNIITGTARINADYTTNPITTGTIKGKVASNLVTLAIKHDKRSATFTGRRAGNSYVGDLKLTVPPARETITNFSLPLTDISVAGGSAVFRGALTFLENRMPVPAVGTTVTIRSDVNGDGQFLGKEIVTGIADKDGRYQVAANIVRGRMVLLEIRRSGFAEVLQSFASLVPGSVQIRNATLQPLAELSVSAGTAEAADGSIRLDGLPNEVESVNARVFDPATETSQFPGTFADNQGNLLVSSVFSTVEATDRSGRSVTNLGQGATICMKVPANSWPTMGDLVQGNEQIDVPLYSYDEKSGEWKRHSSDGWLEDASHIKIPEDQLASIRDGSYVGEVFAAGPISHLSWWNIDWPISSHTCVRGLLLDTNGTPVAGASVSASGVTYTGRSGPETTGPDGTFCLEVMRSETLGEDVDGNGVTGETQQVQLKVNSGTAQFAFGPFTSPVASATCSTGTGLDAGSLTLSDAYRLTVATCTVTGRVVYSGVSSDETPTIQPGGGIPFAQVIGFDMDALSETVAMCTNCMFTTADSLGYFSLQIPILSGASIFASANVTGASGLGVFVGQGTTVGCPAGLVTVEADYFQLGAVVLMLSKGNDPWGSATVRNRGIVVVSYPVGNLLYLGNLDLVDLPTELGSWVIVPMRDNSPQGTFIGSMYFTVTGLEPLSGTWEIKGGSVSASGTWLLDDFGLR